MTIQANSQGVVSGQFTVPPNIVAGTKLVEFNGAGGSRGTTNYVGSNISVERTMRRVFQRFWSWPSDPLAQTFSLDRVTQISGVDLWFTAVGASDIVVQIRGTDVGMPNREVFAERRIAPSEVLTNGTATRVEFAEIPTLMGGVEYALVVLCDDADAALSVAQLGKWDNANSRWVTSQPYQVGVLLSSSNASTWTPHQDMDMTFRLLSPSFTETQKTVHLGTSDAVAVTDLMVLAMVDEPAANARCVFRLTLTDNSNQEITVAQGQAVTLAAPYTGEVRLDAILTGTDTAAPLLYPNIQLAMGNVAETANYVTRQFATNGGTNVMVIFDAVTPGSSQVQVEINDGSTWVSVPFDSGRPVEEDWIERVHILTGFSATNARLRLTMTGNAAARPSVRDLRCLLT